MRFGAMAVGLAITMSRDVRAAAAPAWHESAKLAIPNSGGEFGRCVAIDGDLAVVGAPRGSGSSGKGVGSVSVFRLLGSSWSRVQTIEPPPNEEGAEFGCSCALSGGILAVGAPAEDHPGAVALYRWLPAGFELRTTLRGGAESTKQDDFGRSIAISGTTLAVGAPFASAGQAEFGIISVFVGVQGQWQLQATLRAHSPGVGLGYSLALDRDVLVSGDLTDRAVVYARNGDGWTQEAQFAAPTSRADGAYFEPSVALSGNRLAISWPAASRGDGFVGLYIRAPKGDAGFPTFVPASVLQAPPGTDSFGFSMLFDGSALIAAAVREGVGELASFEAEGPSFVSRAKWFASDSRTGDGFGSTLAISGATLLVGAPRPAGHGQVYVFRKTLDIGDPCESDHPDACVSNFCVDGVCCESACGGGDPSDCLACAGAGAHAGTCGPASKTIVCRAPRSECDQPDHCDGTSTSCPADIVAPNGTSCAGGSCVNGSCAGPPLRPAGAASPEPPAVDTPGCTCKAVRNTRAPRVAQALAALAALAALVFRRFGKGTNR